MNQLLRDVRDKMNNILPDDLNSDTIYAHVKGKIIYHVGRILGYNDEKNEIFLCGAGIKGFPRFGLWLNCRELKPLEDVKNFERHFESLTEPEKRTLKKRERKKKRIGRCGIK